MQLFYVECANHFPWFELGYANSMLEFMLRIKKWHECDLDRSTVCEVLPGMDYQKEFGGFKGNYLEKILDANNNLGKPSMVDIFINCRDQETYEQYKQYRRPDQKSQC